MCLLPRGYILQLLARQCVTVEVPLKTGINSMLLMLILPLTRRSDQRKGAAAPAAVLHERRAEMATWTPEQRRRARWIGGALVIGGVALNLYASALAAFQMGGSCTAFGFTVPDWNCRQASFYSLFSVILVVGGAAAFAASFFRRQGSKAGQPSPPTAASHGAGSDPAVTAKIYTTHMTPDERRFDDVLLALRDMFVRAQGFSPNMLEDLIDPTVRREPRTLNYLVASASGTLQDRYFTPANRDKITENEEDEFNARYRALLDEAVELAWRLSLPAARDRFRR